MIKQPMVDMTAADESFAGAAQGLAPVQSSVAIAAAISAAIPVSTLGYLHDDGAGNRVWRVPTAAEVGALAAAAQATDSAKLGGQLPSYYQVALGFTPLNATAQAADSAKLGGVLAASFPQETDSTWTVAPTSLTVVGTPTYTGKYRKIGNVVLFTIQIKSTTSTSSTSTITYCNLPTIPASPGAASVADHNSGAALPSAMINGVNNFIYLPAWSALSDVIISGFYFTT